MQNNKKKENLQPEILLEKRIYSGNKVKIPEGATYFKVDFDYSNCYYDNDIPEMIVTFYKK
jgi:hypothetical protein